MSYNMFPDYQSLEIGTEGKPGKANRSIPDRLLTYGIPRVVTKESTVLDLGCNRGYFGIVLSSNIKHYTGIEADANQLKYGIIEKMERGITNMSLRSEKYSPASMYGRFDIIICTAFHIYTGVPMTQFGKHLIDMMNPDGHLFLEGHPPGYHLPSVDLNEPESYWNPLTGYLKSQLTIVEEKTVKDRELTRPFIHFQKCG